MLKTANRFSICLQEANWPLYSPFHVNSRDGTATHAITYRKPFLNPQSTLCSICSIESYHGESIHLTLWIKVSQPEYCSTSMFCTMMELVNLSRTESSTPDFGVQWVNMNIFNIRFVWSHTQNRVHRIIWLVELIYQFHKFDKGLSGGHQSSRWSSFWYCYIYKNNEPNL